MAVASFRTNPFGLEELLKDCHNGKLQLPDFQRSWVWDEDRIKGLLASVSRAFPVGALMTLNTGGPVNFKPRPIEGTAEDARKTKPESLLLDGQQRITSLYQSTLRAEVVETVSTKQKRVRRWFYIDIQKALDPTVEREDAIVGVGEDRTIRTDFGREILVDVRTPELEYKSRMFPLNHVFDWDNWQDGFNDHWQSDAHEAIRKEFRRFKNEVLQNFKSYQVPVIALDKETSKEAVCVVFEKVNTGGKALDAFELVTATYAASGHELRKDWYGDATSPGRHQRFTDTLRPPGQNRGIIAEVSNTDFLQAISLFHTRERRREAEDKGKLGKELPTVTGNKHALLNLPLEAYLKYEKQVEQGFVQAAKFLHMQNIFRIRDLPYQSQVVPLAAILADIGDAWEHEGNRAKLVRWYWSGVFGELYGSAVETRNARDFIEVPVWLQGGMEPSTVRETTFRSDRLKTMRMRLSAAYKGLNALLMKTGAQDFRSGQHFDHTVFFGENVDIHHIFPQDWCRKNGIKADVFDSIVNKTPLSYRTNRIIGGEAPSKYLARLEAGDKATPPIPCKRLDAYLRSHLIEPSLLRADDFDGFMRDRQQKLLGLIEQAMGKPAYTGDVPEEGEDLGDFEAAEGEVALVV